jgi:hypothetical protein
MTTMTSAQFAWKRFTSAHIQRECGADEHRDLPDDREDRFDAPVPITASKASKSSTTATSSAKSKRVQFSTTGYLIDKNNRTTATAAAAAIIPDAPTREQVKKAKTRAERRAEEPELVDTEPEKPVARKERRTDYWVQRDDLRRDNARTMKNQFQEFAE